MLKLDGSESRVLQKRLGFRTAPMFLFYYQGALVDAGNDVRSREVKRRGRARVGACRCCGRAV